MRPCYSYRQSYYILSSYDPSCQCTYKLRIEIFDVDNFIHRIVEGFEMQHLSLGLLYYRNLGALWMRSVPNFQK